MTRLLYEVAVLTEETRNRDVQWRLEPICTSEECRIHHSVYPDSFTTSTYDSVWSNENFSQVGDQGQEQAVECTNFEFGQSISGYSNGGTQSTSEFSEEVDMEVTWLRDALVSETCSSTSQPGVADWKDSNTDLLEVVPAPGLDHFGEAGSSQSGVSEKEDSNNAEKISAAADSGNEAKEVSNSRSFRDALMGLGSDDAKPRDCDGSDYFSGAEHKLDKRHRESIINPSMSLSVPGPVEPGEDFQTNVLNKMLGVQDQADDARMCQEYNKQNGHLRISYTPNNKMSASRSTKVTTPGESNSEMSTDCSFTGPSPQTNGFADCEMKENTSPTKKQSKVKKLRRRKKLVANFSSPIKQNGGLTNGSAKYPSPGRQLSCCPSRSHVVPVPGSGSSTMATKHKKNTPERYIEKRSVVSSNFQTNGHFSQNGKEQQSHELANNLRAVVNESGRAPNDSGFCTMNASKIDGGHANSDVSELREGTIGRSVMNVDIAEVETEVPSEPSSELESYLKRSYNRIPLSTNMNQRIVLNNSPYVCGIEHGEEFKTLHNFVHFSCVYPHTLQTRGNLNALLSISQRVVRITVRKPYAPADPFLADEYQIIKSKLHRLNMKGNSSVIPVTEHHGTGFVFYLDFNQIHIRTHSRLVSSPRDAQGALVQFNLNDLGCNGEVTIECVGTATDFFNNSHSQSTVFRAATPPELRPYLHLFPHYPVLHNAGIFNDSCYHTDSNDGESSFEDVPYCPEVQNFQHPTTMKNLYDDVRKTENIWGESGNSSSIGDAPSALGYDTQGGLPHLEFSKINRTHENKVPIVKALMENLSFLGVGSSGSYSRDTTYKEVPRLEQNNTEIIPFAPLLMNGTLSERREKTISKPIGHERVGQKGHKQEPESESDRQSQSDHECWIFRRAPEMSPDDWNTPMGFPARYRPVYDAPYIRVFRPPGSKKNKEVLDVPEVAIGFTPFNSFAADVIAASVQLPTFEFNFSPFPQLKHNFDVTVLLYPQNQTRDEYNAVFRPGIAKHFDHFGKQCNADTRRQLFSPVPDENSVEDIDDFDNVLLGLDVNWTPLQDDLTLESVVTEVIPEENENESESYGQSRKTRFPDVAIMISHPHAGPKRFSCGSFSSAHIGGRLYDAPACMGSCGSPLLSFNKSGHLYLTDVVHSGSTCADGRVMKFGLSHFCDDAYCFSQTAAL